MIQPFQHDALSKRANAEGAALLLGENGLLLFQRFLLVVLAATVASLFYGLQTYGLQLGTLHTLGFATVCLTAYWMMHLGRIQQGVLSVVWGLTAMMVWMALTVAGLRTPVLYIAPMLCMFAAWLAGERTAIGVFSVTAVTMVVLAVGETYFGYVPPNVARKPIGLAILMVPCIFASLLISLYAFRSFKSKIAQVMELTEAQKIQLEELRLSEERFAALFRANPTPSSTVDAEGRTKDVNDAWVVLFGISAEQARDKTTQELGLWSDPADRAEILSEFAAKGNVAGRPVCLKTASGTRTFLLYISPVQYAGRQRLVTSLVDQTDRLAVEAAQRAVNEALEERVALRTAELSQTVSRLTATQEELVQAEKLASLGAMVAGISHELNTPIGNTVTVSSTLQSQVRDFKKLVEAGQLRKSDLLEFLGLLEEMSDVIARSTRRAAELVTSFKQVAVDRSSERRRTFDVATLVQELITAFKPSMRQRSISVTMDIPAGITCDSFPGPIGQVLTNLIQNALTHAFDETVTGNITIEAHAEGDAVVLQVRDNGCGMSEHTLRHAFDPFFTTRLGQGGSGLGLSVSHRIASSVLGGALTASSTPGQGSCFTFSFLRNLSDEG